MVSLYIYIYKIIYNSYTCRLILFNSFYFHSILLMLLRYLFGLNTLIIITIITAPLLSIYDLIYSIKHTNYEYISRVLVSVYTISLFYALLCPIFRYFIKKYTIMIKNNKAK